jgi:hypothetical protein
MGFSLTEKERREEIIRAVCAELHGGPKTGLSPREDHSVLFFQQIDLSVVRRTPPSGPARQRASSVAQTTTRQQFRGVLR